MLTTIIETARASESYTNALIDAGILIITDKGLKCTEKTGLYTLCITGPGK